LRLCRETVVRLGKTESALVRSLQRDSLARANPGIAHRKYPLAPRSLTE
jgi:hypothetical protein